MNALRPVLAVALGLLLSACATSTPEVAGRSWSDGWRKATVVNIKSELSWPQSPSCGKVATGGERYVVLSYRLSGQTRWKYIPVSESKAPAVGDKMLMNVNSCELVRV